MMHHLCLGRSFGETSINITTPDVYHQPTMGAKNKIPYSDNRLFSVLVRCVWSTISLYRAVVLPIYIRLLLQHVKKNCPVETDLDETRLWVQGVSLLAKSEDDDINTTTNTIVTRITRVWEETQSNKIQPFWKTARAWISLFPHHQQRLRITSGDSNGSSLWIHALTNVSSHQEPAWSYLVKDVKWNMLFHLLDPSYYLSLVEKTRELYTSILRPI